MVDILKNFYMVHYNILAVLVLMIFLGIFFAVKKNVKGIIVLLVLLIASNVIVFSKTNGKAWSRQFFMDDEYKEKYALFTRVEKNPVREEFRDSMSFTFSAGSEKFPWVVVDASPNSTKIFHWCWVDELWESFASINIVDKLWGTKNVKAARESSEHRVDALGN